MAEEGGGEDVTVPVLPALPPPMDVPPSPEPAAAAAQDAQDTSATTTTTAALNALAAAGTATAAAAAAQPVPTTPPPGRFFALSSGSTEGEASQDWTIFGSWDAARRYLESRDVNASPAASPAGTAGGTAAGVPANDAAGVPAGGRQYRGFDDIMSAVLFASHGTVPMSAVIKPGAAASVAVASTAAASAPTAGGKVSGRPRGRPRKKTGSATASTAAASAPADSATTATAASAAAAPAADPQATSENAAPAPGGTAGTATPAAAAATAPRKRRPNKRWEKNYEILSSIRRRTGTFDVHSDDEEVVALSRQAAAASSSAGGTEGEEGTPTPKKKPKRTQAEKLRRWVADQRKEYQLHSQGQKSAMTVDKLVRLGRLGFDFGGTGAGTASPAELPIAAAAAAQSTGAGAASAAAAAVSTVASKSNLNKFGNEKHIRKKKRTLTPAKQREADEEWRRMFRQLLAFKEREGHCHVPATRRDDLSKWVSKQRYEYKLLREGSGISNLTTTQLLELQDAGFVFAPRKGAYVTWEERVDQLREYRNRHGHVRVSTSDKQLGSFVRSQRVAYRKRNAGKTTSLTDERMEQLLELGFEFEVESGGSKKRKKQSPTVTMVSQNDYYY